MSTLPLVSVIVLNYKRLDELKVCLRSILVQDYPRIETIVVDNHSEQDVAGVVAACGDGIRLIELSSNLGPCGGRNAGIREASGDILITLDNDVSFASPHDVRNTVQAFQDHPAIHVLAFHIGDAGTGKTRIREWCHPRDWRQFAGSEFETSFFGEGASAYRREVFHVVGLYWEPLFIGNEGYDLALRIFSHGFKILYCPRVSVCHSMSPETRPSDRPFYYYTRNYIWIAYRHYRLVSGARFLIPKLVMMLFFSLRSGRPHVFLRGVWAGVRGIRQIESRKPIAEGAMQYLELIERTRPSLFARVARHWSDTQL
jgi:GT2 family glycosyltransferase